MRQAAALLDPAWAALATRLGAAFAATDPQTLLVDYTRLFLGPVNALARPYGSVWLSGEASLMQDSSMAVLGIYREGGFDLSERPFANCPITSPPSWNSSTCSSTGRTWRSANPTSTAWP